MLKNDREFPNYYDGSSHLEFAEELVDGLESEPQEDRAAKEEWRRYIGANPFGMYEQ